MRIALFWDITQRVEVIYYRRFGTSHRFHLQGSRVGCPEASVRNYHYSLRNNPEERSFQNLMLLLNDQASWLKR